jgi:hypothetical protein
VDRRREDTLNPPATLRALDVPRATAPSLPRATASRLGQLRAELASLTGGAARPACLEEAYADPAAFWDGIAAELIAAAPGVPSSAVFEWYTLFHEFGRRHASSGRAAFCEFSPAAGFRDSSYEAITRKAQSVAGAWRKRGVVAGASVCIVLEPSPTSVICLLAAWCCGAAVTLIPPDGPSFVLRALLALGLEPLAPAARAKAAAAAASADAASGAPPAPPGAFVVSGTRAKPWLSELDPASMLHWEVPAGTRALAEPHRFPAAAIAARFFSPLGDDWDHPVELSAEQVYLSALRDGLLAFQLAPGQSVAAPGFSDVQFKPALLLMTLACGATWVELDTAELSDGRALLDGRISVLGVTSSVRDLLSGGPLLARARLARWFRNIAEDNDAARWASFEEALAAQGAMGMNYFANSAAGGSLLFSAWCPRPIARGVWRSPGVPCELGEPNGTGMPPLGDVAMLTPLKPKKNAPGIQAGLPASALGRVVLATTPSSDIWVTNLGSHRSAVVLPEQQIEELLAAAHPGLVRAAVLVVLPVHHQASRQRVALVVFASPSDRARGLAVTIADYLRSELGEERSPDRVEVFELNPKLVDPKAPEPEIDRPGCAGQFTGGTLWGKSRCRTFRELAALFVEVVRVREYRAMLAAAAKGA